jgi:hypothetical protein
MVLLLVAEEAEEAEEAVVVEEEALQTDGGEEARPRCSCPMACMVNNNFLCK